MSELNTYQIQQALETLTWNHGYGDIIRIDYADSTFIVKGYMLSPECRKFSVKGNTVRAWGHSKVANHYKAPQS